MQDNKQFKQKKYQKRFSKTEVDQGSKEVTQEDVTANQAKVTATNGAGKRPRKQLLQQLSKKWW